MGSKKDWIKKSLGITEYPWSSDEEVEHGPLETSESSHQQGSGSRPSASAGAGVAPLPTPVTRRQAKIERNLYWSLLNNSMRTGPPPPPPPPRRLVPRRNSNPDIQRLLAMKKIIREMSEHRTIVPGSSSYASSKAALYSGLNRTIFRNASPTTESTGSQPNESGVGVASSSRLWRRRDDDVAQTSPTPGPSHLSVEQHRDNPEPSTSRRVMFNITNDAGLVRNHNAVQLEEEIVEIDGGEPAAASAADLPPTNEASTSGSIQEDRQNPRQVKRKRPDSEDNVEQPLSAKDFNQEVLRLLECPVCLEWMEPPICQCRRGHLVCGRCRSRLVDCPVCRTPLSSVRNRAMEGVAALLRYPCRHGCGRELRQRRRASHEANCNLRRYRCPVPNCNHFADIATLPGHFQSRHLPLVKIGSRHNIPIDYSAERHDDWLMSALDNYFHLRIDFESFRLFVYVSYIGPKRDAKNYTYEISISSQQCNRKLVYMRSTHSDNGESATSSVNRDDCFSISRDQAFNFVRSRTGHSELELKVEINKVDEGREESDS